MTHELILLSPYRFPGQNSLLLANEDMACWLNGWTALWHPAALWQAAGVPRYDTPYDYENPKAGQVYAVPESPPLIMPDDWDERVRAAGAIAFKATTERDTTLANLKEALAKLLPSAAPPADGAGSEPNERPPESASFPSDQGQTQATTTLTETDVLAKLVRLEQEKVAPFFGLGMGHLLLATLSEAMEHENLLDNSAFFQDLQNSLSSLAGIPYPAAASADQSTAGYTGSDTSPPPADYEEFAAMPPAEELEDAPQPEAESTGFEEFAPADDRRENVGEWDGENVAGTEASPGSAAAAGPDAWYGHLQSAGEKLLSAREVLYPVTIHLLDVFILDEKRLAEAWPASFDQDAPLNVLASSALLEKLARDHPDRLAALRRRVEAEQVEVCGGSYLEREDPLLPFDSQLWNLLKGQAVARELLGTEPRIFARKRFGFHPQLPLLLTTTGLTRAVLLTFDDSGVPQYQSCVVGWPSPDGKQVDAFVRQPQPADSAQTFFNLGHYWFKTTREDHTATLALLHTGSPAAPWYHDVLALAKLSNMLGQWETLSRYFNDVMAGEHASALSADEFHSDYLSERTNAQQPAAVSAFARHVRLRRRLDTCWTLAALQRGLAGQNDPLRVDNELRSLEDCLECSFPSPGVATPGTAPDPLLSLAEFEKKISSTLAERLQSRAEANQPGYLLLNPCSFVRRLALELDGAARPLPIVGPVKACQLDGDKLRVVVEVPPLGFSWIAREGPPGTTAAAARMRLADQNIVRNEFFEAEIDPATGALRAIRDHKTRLNRLGQRLVFNPGSFMRATDVRVTSAGPALGELVSEGMLLGEQQQVLAKFRQRFRAWLGRPVLELRIDIHPEQPPAGYPWHAYYGARFAWRDERAVLLRGVNGTSYITTHPRPQTPDFLEVRLGRQSTTLFPGGLPFHQRHEGRMVDIILISEGERETSFDIGIGLDREYPMQTALGMVTPAVVVPTTKGPPHIGATGWLFHLDAPNLLLSQIAPGGLEKLTDENGAPRTLTDAITARLLECAAHSGQAELRCVRNPTRSSVLDARGGLLVGASPSGDGVFFEVSPGDLVHLQVEFG